MPDLRRELSEEIGLVLGENDARHVGCYSAPLANEPDHTVEAEIFHVRVRHDPALRSEIEEALWVDPITATAMSLTPLAHDYILPKDRALIWVPLHYRISSTDASTAFMSAEIFGTPASVSSACLIAMA